MTAASIPSRLIAAASIVAMLAHAFLGCCWHHGHAEESHGCAQAASVEEHDHHPCERNRNTHSVAHSHHAPADQHSPHPTPCDEPDCSYLASPAPEIDAPIVSFEFSPLASEIATGLSSLPAATPSASASLPLSTARVRAALQVWVV